MPDRRPHNQIEQRAQDAQCDEVDQKDGEDTRHHVPQELHGRRESIREQGRKGKQEQRLNHMPGQPEDQQRDSRPGENDQRKPDSPQPCGDHCHGVTIVG